MRISARSMILFAIGLIVFAGFLGGRYFLNNRMVEIGILAAIILLLYTAILSAMNVRDHTFNWSMWFFTPILFLSYIMVVPPYIFATNQGGLPIFPAVLASREFMFILLCPSIYMAYRLGVTLKEVENAVLASLIVIIISYLFFRFTLPLEQYFNGPKTDYGFTLVTYDEGRGYRLKPPLTGLSVSSLAFFIKITQARTNLKRFFWIIMFLLAAFAILIQQGRSLTATIIAAPIVYLVLFGNRNRLPLFLLILPIIAILIYPLISQFFAGLEELYYRGAGVRHHTYAQAFAVIKEQPLLGFGLGSNYTISEGDLFDHFYATDIGVVGVTFRYGIFGAALYWITVFFMLGRLIKVQWLYKRAYGYANPLLFGIAVKMLGDVFKFLLTVDYIRAEGITTLAIAIGLTAAYRHKFSTHTPKQHPLPHVAQQSNPAKQPATPFHQNYQR